MNRITLLVVTALAAGCGSGSSSAPVAVAPPPGPPTSRADVPPVKPTPPAESAPVVDRFEMDPAKHVIPDAPATGRLRGQPFTPDRVELQGNQLTLRQGKDFFADLQITMFLDDKRAKSGDGFKLTVSPSQKWTDGIPSLHVSAREGKGLPDTKFVNDDYAMTLELGKAEKGKMPGKIYLSLPDSQRSYLAGTFVAERKRALHEPPGPEEVPFVQGKVEPAVRKGQQVWVGYVGLPAAGGSPISDGAGTEPFGDDGSSGAARSESSAPRRAGIRFEKFVPHFDFTNLPPGKFLIYARLGDRPGKGPCAWQQVDVAPDSRLTANLTLTPDPARLGAVAVTAPAGLDLKAPVRLVPAEAATSDLGPAFAGQVGSALGYEAKPRAGGTTKIADVPAGKYLVQAPGNPDVPPVTTDVAPGQTTTVELKPAKK